MDKFENLNNATFEYCKIVFATNISGDEVLNFCEWNNVILNDIQQIKLKTKYNVKLGSSIDRIKLGAQVECLCKVIGEEYNCRVQIYSDEDNVTSIMQVKAITFILSPKIIDDYESKKH